MQELSLNILDIAQNSIKAKATLISITICEAVIQNQMTITIQDNGCGMSREQLEVVTNPFFTTRTTRKVGLGVPFFKMSAEMAGGTFAISSTLGEGTQLRATFVHDNIDRMPLGNMSETMLVLVQGNPQIDFVYTHEYNEQSFVMDTRAFRQILEDVPLNDASVLQFIREFICENYNNIRKA